MKIKRLLFISVGLLALILLCDSCQREIEVRQEIFLDLSAIPEYPSYRAESDNNVKNNEILLKGYVIDSDSGDSVGGVHVRLTGTDSPEVLTTTAADGSYEILLPIVPKRNGDVIKLVLNFKKTVQTITPYSVYARIACMILTIRYVNFWR